MHLQLVDTKQEITDALVCARQMRLAWEDVMHDKFSTEAGWEQMCANYAYFYTHNHLAINYDIP